MAAIRELLESAKLMQAVTRHATRGIEETTRQLIEPARQFREAMEKTTNSARFLRAAMAHIETPHLLAAQALKSCIQLQEGLECVRKQQKLYQDMVDQIPLVSPAAFTRDFDFGFVEISPQENLEDMVRRVIAEELDKRVPNNGDDADDDTPTFH